MLEETIKESSKKETQWGQDNGGIDGDKTGKAQDY